MSADRPPTDRGSREWAEYSSRLTGTPVEFPEYFSPPPPGQRQSPLPVADVSAQRSPSSPPQWSPSPPSPQLSLSPFASQDEEGLAPRTLDLSHLQPDFSFVPENMIIAEVGLPNKSAFVRAKVPGDVYDILFDEDGDGKMAFQKLQQDQLTLDQTLEGLDVERMPVNECFRVSMRRKLAWVFTTVGDVGEALKPSVLVPRSGITRDAPINLDLPVYYFGRMPAGNRANPLQKNNSGVPVIRMARNKGAGRKQDPEYADYQRAYEPFSQRANVDLFDDALVQHTAEFARKFPAFDRTKICEMAAIDAVHKFREDLASAKNKAKSNYSEMILAIVFFFWLPTLPSAHDMLADNEQTMPAHIPAKSWVDLILATCQDNWRVDIYKRYASIRGGVWNMMYQKSLEDIGTYVPGKDMKDDPYCLAILATELLPFAPRAKPSTVRSSAMYPSKVVSVQIGALKTDERTLVFFNHINATFNAAYGFGSAGTSAVSTLPSGSDDIDLRGFEGIDFSGWGDLSAQDIDLAVEQTDLFVSESESDGTQTDEFGEDPLKSLFDSTPVEKDQRNRTIVRWSDVSDEETLRQKGVYMSPFDPSTPLSPGLGGSPGLDGDNPKDPKRLARALLRALAAAAMHDPVAKAKLHAIVEHNSPKKFSHHQITAALMMSHGNEHEAFARLLRNRSRVESRSRKCH